jgi:hypothetical protein
LGTINLTIYYFVILYAMILNTSEIHLPLIGKHWKSEHSFVKWGQITLKKCSEGYLVPTVLKNTCSDGRIVEKPSLYPVSVYELGQLMGGN